MDHDFHGVTMRRRIYTNKDGSVTPTEAKRRAREKEIDPQAQSFSRTFSDWLDRNNWTVPDLNRVVSNLTPMGEKFHRTLPYRWLQGHAMPSQSSIDWLVKAFKCKVEDLVPPGAGHIIGKDDVNIQIAMIGEGMVRLKFNQVVPEAIAHQITKILNQAPKGE